MAGLRQLSRIAVLCMALATAPPVIARGGKGRGATMNSSVDESTLGSITFAFLVIFAIACLLQTGNVSILIFRRSRRRSMNHTHLNTTPFLLLLLLGTISLFSSYILGAIVVPSFYSSTRLNPIVSPMWTFTDRLGSLFIYGGIFFILEALISNLAPEPILPRLTFCGLGRTRTRRVVGAVLFSLMVIAILAPVVIRMVASSGGKHRRGKMYRTFGAVYVVTYILLAFHNLLSSTYLWMISRKIKSDMAEDHKIQILSTIALRICPLLMIVALFKFSVFIIQHAPSRKFAINNNILLIVTILLEGVSLLMIINQSCRCIGRPQPSPAAAQESL